MIEIDDPLQTQIPQPSAWVCWAPWFEQMIEPENCLQRGGRKKHIPINVHTMQKLSKNDRSCNTVKFKINVNLIFIHMRTTNIISIGFTQQSVENTILKG